VGEPAYGSLKGEMSGKRTRQTSIELNFAVLKFKHTVKRKK
jgi:hypothetical protein